MSLWYQSANQPAAVIRRLAFRLQSVRARASRLYGAWTCERSIRRSRHALEALPENILHDIGWPNVEDRLPHARCRQPGGK